MNAIFITGTDTNIGKTFVSGLLLKEFNALNLKTFAMKPIASGCQESDNGTLKNSDAVYLQTLASIKQPYSVVNPIALREPIAPHLAAQEMGFSLSKAIVKDAILFSYQLEADITIIEGAGGWAMPLNSYELFSEVISELNIPVILVVGMKLGCLNHAILTAKDIIYKKLPLMGWIANCLVPDMRYLEENISTLQQWIKRPCLGIIPYNCQTPGYIQAQEILKLLF